MFYGQCWKCGERWGLGTASTCKCPEETTIDWTEEKSPSPVFTLSDTKPNYNMTFNRDGIQVGALDFNGPEMVFTGNADESAKVFFDFIARSFKARLEQERSDEREACAELCDDLPLPPDVARSDASIWEFATLDCAEAIRARGETSLRSNT